MSTGAPLFVPTFRDLSADVEALVPGSPASLAGLEVGDHIVKVNGKDISTKSELLDIVGKSKGQPVSLEVRRETQLKTFTATPVPVSGEGSAGDDPLYTIGVEETPSLVTSVMHGSPAATAGIQPGDRVVAIEGGAIYAWSQMTTQVREHPQNP
ncbi:MAG: PDZ domain-containing protein [Nitrospira sp.]